MIIQTILLITDKYNFDTNSMLARTRLAAALVFPNDDAALFLHIKKKTKNFLALVNK